MTATGLSKAFATLPLRPLGTLVHIGVRDPEAAEVLAALDPIRMVLVSHNREIAAALRQSMQHSSVVAEVLCTAVAAVQGPLPWYECMPVEASGPLVPIALDKYFPRARIGERVEVSAIGIADLLSPRVSVPDSQRPNLLIIDEPGRSATLLDAIPEETLLRFDWIAVRCARDGVFANGEPAAAASRLLLALHYELQPVAVDADALWSLSLFRRDRTAAALSELRSQIQTLRDELRGRDEALARAGMAPVKADSDRQEYTAQSARVAELNATVAALRAELYRQSRLQPGSEPTAVEAGNDSDVHARVFRLGAIGEALSPEAISGLRSNEDSAQQAALGALASVIAGITHDMSAPPLSLVDFPFDGHSFRLVHVAGDHIPRTIARKGQFYEIDLLRLVSRFHREGELVIDCGANIGNHTLYFARCLGARVLAVEPEPHNFTLLRANLALNAAAGVVAQHFALGKEAGVATLHQCIANNSGSFTASAKRRAAETPAEAGHDVEVPVITLDELLERCRLTVPVSILKLDVEGMEAEILLGAKRLLRLWLPLVAAECASRSELAQVEAVLEPWDYYPVEVVNVTPTFVFASRNNAFHANRLKDYLRGSALDRASRNTSFT